MGIILGGSKANLIISYDEAENSHENYGKNTWLAQTFTLSAAYHTWRCRFKSWTICHGYPYHYAIRQADIYDKPFGPDLVHTTLSPSGEYSHSPGRWRRFDFSTMLLLSPGHYALVASAPDDPSASCNKLRSKELPAGLPSEKTWRSTDSGNSWIWIPNTTLLFEVWGWEPPPDAPPPPVIDNWAPTDLKIIPTAEGVYFIFTTSSPCHLFMRQSSVKPRKHLEPALRRGLAMHTNPRFCFVAWQEHEQLEPGDTYIHTFLKEPWPVCETHYFYFVGTRCSQQASSVSPIFTYHNTGLIGDLIILEPWTWKETFAPSYSLLFLENWGDTPPVPPWSFYEPWGDTLTENNPWEYNIPLGGVEWELYQGLLRLYDPAMDGCGIKVNFVPDQIPLVNIDLESLIFQAGSTAPPPLTHDAYIPFFLYTTNGVDNYLIEMIVTRGDAWGPWGSQLWAGANTCGKDYGLDPGPENIKDFWVWARTIAGLPADPSGWYIKRIALLFEAVEYEEEPYVINNWVGLWHQP